MRYFFLAFTLIAVLVVSFCGFRGQLFSHTPIRVFPDMDDQDKLKSQAHTDFFANGLAARKPVVNTVPRGFEIDGSSYNFGNSTAYIHTGHIDETYGDGMPEELGLTDENTLGFLRHGKERYKVSCMPCHGESGNGGGTVAKIGIAAVPSLMSFSSDKYPDGKMFEVITMGKGLMSGYGYNIPTKDRWAIIAYVRTLQAARSVPAK
ncbi:MAG: c-type cytochrome [Akkermansiaceae bacterium]